MFFLQIVEFPIPISPSFQINFFPHEMQNKQKPKFDQCLRKPFIWAERLWPWERCLGWRTVFAIRLMCAMRTIPVRRTLPKWTYPSKTFPSPGKHKQTHLWSRKTYLYFLYFLGLLIHLSHVQATGKDFLLANVTSLMPLEWLPLHPINDNNMFEGKPSNKCRLQQSHTNN